MGCLKERRLAYLVAEKLGHHDTDRAGRADVHYRTAALPTHVIGGRNGPEQWGVGIDLHDVAPLLPGPALKRYERPDRRIVDQHVNATKRLQRGSNRRLRHVLIDGVPWDA